MKVVVLPCVCTNDGHMCISATGKGNTDSREAKYNSQMTPRKQTCAFEWKKHVSG